MAEPKTLPTVRQHADEVISKLIADNPPSEEALNAAAIPTFSSGTRAIDPNNGQPITTEPGSFSAGKVAVEPSAGPAPDPAPPTQLAPPPPDANAKRETPPAASGGPPAPPSGTVAAEQAAQQIADVWAEYDELEIEDPDLDVKIPLRVPKRFAEPVKRGYGRRAAYDRNTSYLKNAEPTLKPLIEDGRLQRVLPLIQRALDDPAYGEYVWGGYQRSVQGLPLIEQARAEAAAAGERPPPTPSTNGAGFTVPENVDPYLAEQLTPLVQSAVAPLQQKLQTYEEREREEQERQRQSAQQQAWQNAQFFAAHQDVAQRYPQSYRLDLAHQDPMLARAIKYANDAGYVERYGIRAGVLFAADALAQIDAERIAATGSPTAAALQSAEARLTEAARQQARAAAQTVSGGTPTQQPTPAPPSLPSRFDANGKIKPPAVYMAEMQAAIAAGATPA